MIVHVDGEYSHIECDKKGCGQKSPPAAVLIAKHGLTGLGWSIHPGLHKCPTHFYDDVEPQGPQRRTRKQQDRLDGKAKK
jgi:hypothetical protein